ncbi:MAG: hypothetical protein SGI87_06340 [Flavobacteriales bacterium]|nr:hypothetical protein [Flavobacteriales bacterium]
MKTITYVLLICLTPLWSWSQSPFLNLVVEETSIPEPQYTELSAELGGEAHTIRVYANIPENWEIQVMYGFSIAPLTVSAPEGFYHNNIGGPTSAEIVEAAYVINPLLQYDSWITIGWDNSIDNGLEQLPLDAPFLSAWEAGGDLVSNDFLGGSIFVITPPELFPPNTGDVNGNVLVGQFTSDGPINGCLNFQMRRLNSDGTVFDPAGSAASETVEFNNVCFDFSPPPIGGNCLGDLTGDNYVGTADLLILTSQVGCQSGCVADFTGDDKTTGSDVLVFLSAYGANCN